MRKVEAVYHLRHPSYEDGLWIVVFDGESNVAVDAPHLETLRGQVTLAAVAYSNAHPEGALASIVVDLSGKQKNLTAEDRKFLNEVGISPFINPA